MSEVEKCPRCGSRHFQVYKLNDGQTMERCKDCRKSWPIQPLTVFQSEVMECCICGKQKQSDPNQSSDWRYIKADETGYYVCLDHFPADGSPAKEFEAAYLAVLHRILELRKVE